MPITSTKTKVGSGCCANRRGGNSCLQLAILSARKLDFQPRKLCLWAEVALAATRKSSLQSGVTLHKAGRSRQTYGFDLQLLLKQIEEGKQSHSQRLEGLRQGKLLASTPG